MTGAAIAFQPLMGNGNTVSRELEKCFARLPTPHGEREPQNEALRSQALSTFQPLMGNGNPGYQKSIGPSCQSSNPSWGTGTGIFAQIVEAVRRLPTPHGERELGNFLPPGATLTGFQPLMGNGNRRRHRHGHRPYYIASNPSWGTGTNLAPCSQLTLITLPTPHGEREL